MLRFFPLVILLWPLSTQAEYFRGVDAIARHDIPVAIRELTPEANAGVADAQNALGVAYDRDGTPAGATKARELFRLSAENGLYLAYINLAQSLQASRGGPANPAEAAEWLTRVAQAGIVPAMVKLAEAYRDGIGVPHDTTTAQSWYERAANANDPDGMAGLADLLLFTPNAAPSNMPSAIGWLQRASDRGQPHAQGELAKAKILGLPGVAKDEAGGVALARSAAAAGDAGAAELLAECYDRGFGMPASGTEATRWYAEAARRGDVRGQYETARRRLAPGPDHDAAAAYLWTQLAGRKPSTITAEIASLDAKAAHELNPQQPPQLRARAAAWQPGSNP